MWVIGLAYSLAGDTGFAVSVRKGIKSGKAIRPGTIINTYSIGIWFELDTVVSVHLGTVIGTRSATAVSIVVGSNPPIVTTELGRGYNGRSVGSGSEVTLREVETAGGSGGSRVVGESVEGGGGWLGAGVRQSECKSAGAHERQKEAGMHVENGDV